MKYQKFSSVINAGLTEVDMQDNAVESSPKMKKKSNGNSFAKKRKMDSTSAKHVNTSSESEVETQSSESSNVKPECQSVFEYVDVNSHQNRDGKNSKMKDKLKNLHANKIKNNNKQKICSILDAILHAKQEELFSSFEAVDLLQNLIEGQSMENKTENMEMVNGLLLTGEKKTPE
uniref:Uncharacterized protein n=2 Tax=Graphocephala atropunctata TaxID=36148 RepID=A0A1B6LNM1_9HEMI